MDGHLSRCCVIWCFFTVISWTSLMNILVTAGNTQMPIDRVRCLTNIFSGRTGTEVAAHAHGLGHHVTLLTSRPEAILELDPRRPLADDRWRPLRYRTFNDLACLMAQELERDSCNAVIHSAAVSDYTAAGIFAPAPGTHFSTADGTWTGDPPALLSRGAAKVKSDESEMWLRLVRAPKLVDKVRTAWSFRGVLVKFKLEVGISEKRLLEIAEPSRLQSDADLMVANTLEGSHEWAYLGPQDGAYERIARRELPQRLLAAVERNHMERTHA
jgi:phosphopantothenate---cysteine ligase (CTP)